MNGEQVADRLRQLREAVQQRLTSDPTARIRPEAPSPEGLALPDVEPYSLPDEPSLGTTTHQQECNARAEITGPLSMSSSVPVLGAVLTLLRRLVRPLVKAHIDPYLVRQERFNVQAVRHMNELGERLEQRLQNINKASREWSTGAGGLERRLQATLDSYDATLRKRYGVLFGALEEELISLQNSVEESTRQRNAELAQLEALVVERAQAVDKRFDEKDRALEAALEAQSKETEAALEATIPQLVLPRVSELMSLRQRLQEVLEVLDAAQPADDSDRLPVGSTVRGSKRGDQGGERAKLLAAPAVPAWDELQGWLLDEDYRAFQAAFRGESQEIRCSMKAHVKRFAAVKGPIVDLGCGGGEFVELLNETGKEAIGVEINAADVADCKGRGLRVEQADLFDWLECRAEGSLGGILLTQVIEHLPPDAWGRLLRLSFSRLHVGGRLVIETINPQSLYAMVRAYVIDPTPCAPPYTRAC